MSIDLLIKGGGIVDGTGRPALRADVAIASGRIAAIGSIDAPEGVDVIDAAGLCVSPGFIDIHSHSDYTLLVDPRAISSITQGVTLEVVGNCGHGCAPIFDRALAPMAIYGPVSRFGLASDGMGAYLERLDKARPAVNVVALVPHGQLRLGTVGTAQRPGTPDELGRMKAALAKALDEGAHGFSTGLEYAQEVSATEAEVAELCTVTAAAGGLYATHTRNRDEGAVAAVAEAIRTAERSNIKLQVSHISPRSGIAVTEACLDLVDAARRRGLPVGFDMHTRLFGFTHLKNILPAWALAGSPQDVVARLDDARQREKMRTHRSLITALGDWERVSLVSSRQNKDIEGVPFAEIGRRRGMPPLDCAYDILKAEADDLFVPMVVMQSYSEEQLRLTYQAPDCLIGSDATALAPDGPLAGEVFYGAYTWASWFYRRMVRETRTFAPEEAIHRLTQLPATVLGLSDRGMIAVGAQADIVAFDSARFGEQGTLAEPNRIAQGMRHVVVNGVVTLRDGRLTGARGGQVLRRAHAGG